MIPLFGGYLVVLHKRVGGNALFRYVHLLVELDEQFAPIRRSEPFTFDGAPVEYCAGMSVCEKKGLCVFSYGVMDRSAVIAAYQLDDIRRLLKASVSSYDDLDMITIRHEFPFEDAARALAARDAVIWGLKLELLAFARKNRSAEWIRRSITSIWRTLRP